MPLRAQVGVSHRSLIKVAELMEENIEKPLSLDEIARATGLSRRQIERLFKRHLQLRAEALLPGDAPAPGAGAAAADRDADHGHHDLLRLPVAAAFLPLLPQPVRPSARARSAQIRQSGGGRPALECAVPASQFRRRMSSMGMRLSRNGQSRPGLPLNIRVNRASRGARKWLNQLRASSTCARSTTRSSPSRCTTTCTTA